jgi:hypothetical protein
MKGENHAFDSFSDCTGYRWGDPLGDQQLHTDAVYHKENPECGSGYRCDHLALECLWAHWKHLEYSCREVNGLKQALKTAKGDEYEKSIVSCSVFCRRVCSRVEYVARGSCRKKGNGLLEIGDRLADEHADALGRSHNLDKKLYHQLRCRS